ncbi:MAG TPA: hypothetical protein VH186_23950 [Chloroflexia bacterium]|nr:hypothetical protein [Chloroflexia bacterium]
MLPEDRYNLAKFDVAYFNAIIEKYRLHSPEGLVSLRNLLAGMRIDCRYSTLTPNLNGLAMVVPGTHECKIRIKRELEPCWRRFILGHEVGHIFQYNQGKLLFSVAQDWAEASPDAWQMGGPVEEEAYAISAFLYIPLDLLKEALYAGSPFEAIAAQLAVPSTAVKMRLDIALATGEFL